MTEQAITSSGTRQAPKGNMPALAMSALGIVFGDIGTSPLYTFKTVLGLTGDAARPGHRPRRAVADAVDALHHHDGQICLLRHARRQ